MLKSLFNVLRRIPFTLLMLGGLALVALLTETHSCIYGEGPMGRR